MDVDTCVDEFIKAAYKEHDRGHGGDQGDHSVKEAWVIVDYFKGEWLDEPFDVHIIL